MFNAIQNNSRVEAQLLESIIQTASGVTSLEDLSWCLKTNDTYQNCPINQKATDSFALVLYNPSQLD